MVKAVIFDLDNTLYDYDAVNERAIEAAGKWLCAEAQIAYEEFLKAFQKGREQTKKALRNCAAQHNRIIYFQKASEYLGLNPVKYSLELYDVYWGYMLKYMCPGPGVWELLQRLNQSGVKVAVCTDLTTHIQHRKLRELGIADFVDVFVSSEEAGAEKPDRRIFDMTIHKLGMPPSEMIYVGDSYEKDVIGASDAGIRPVWFNPYGRLRKGREVKKTLEITRMEELERHIYMEEDIWKKTRYGRRKCCDF